MKELLIKMLAYVRTRDFIEGMIILVVVLFFFTLTPNIDRIYNFFTSNSNNGNSTSFVTIENQTDENSTSIVQEVKNVNIKKDEMDNNTETDENDVLKQFVYENMLKDSKLFIPKTIIKEITKEVTNYKDPLLMYSIIYVESRFNPFAISSSGAVGLGQILWKVWKDKLKSWGVINEYRDIFEIDKNIRAVDMVLAYYLNRYNKDIYKALIHYNCGNNVCAQGKKYAQAVINKYGVMTFKYQNLFKAK